MDLTQTPRGALAEPGHHLNGGTQGQGPPGALASEQCLSQAQAVPFALRHAPCWWTVVSTPGPAGVGELGLSRMQAGGLPGGGGQTARRGKGGPWSAGGGAHVSVTVGAVQGTGVHLWDTSMAIHRGLVGKCLPRPEPTPQPPSPPPPPGPSSTPHFLSSSPPSFPTLLCSEDEVTGRQVSKAVSCLSVSSDPVKTDVWSRCEGTGV